MMFRLKELEYEIQRLNKMYLEEKLQSEVVAETLENSGEAISQMGDGHQSGSKKGAAHLGWLLGFSHQRWFLSV
jgi:hypothetical protein